MITGILASTATQQASLAQADISSDLLGKLSKAINPLSDIDDTSYMCESRLATTVIENGGRRSSDYNAITRVNKPHIAHAYYTTTMSPNSLSKPFESLLSLNSKYLLKAERSKKSDAWVMTNVWTNDDSLAAEQSEFLRVLTMVSKPAFRDIQNAPLQVGNTPPPGRLESLPGFMIESSSYDIQLQRVTINFRCRSSIDDPAKPLTKCRVVYDLKQYGILASFAENTKSEDGERNYNVDT